MQGEQHLEKLVADALSVAPASTARELKRSLASAPGQVDVRRRDINRVLYRSAKFTHDDSPRPRWILASDTRSRNEAVERQRAATAERTRRSLARDTATSMLAATHRPMSGPPTDKEVLLNGSTWILTQLYPWQREALTAWFRNAGRGIVEAVTGTGKTHLGLEAASRMQAAGGRTVILVPTVELQRQWVERFAENTPHLSLATVGGESGGAALQADVTVALVQSARLRHLSGGRGEVLLIADETHRYGSRSWADALEDGYDYRLGLTATLERGGDDGVDEVLLPYFEKVVFRYGYKRAVPEDVVAPFALAFLGVSLTGEEHQRYESLSRKIGKAWAVLDEHGLLRGTPGEQAARIAAARSQPGALGQAARDFQDRTRQRRNLLANAEAKVGAVRRLAPLIRAAQGTVIFTQTKDVADDTAAELRGQGVRAAAVHSGMDNEERRANLDGLKDQTLEALCAPKILDEGIDVPSIDLGVIMSASSTRRQMVQRLGRVIRRKPDGRPATLIVVYAQGTVEDPDRGAHEVFLETVRDVAAAQLTWGTTWSVEEIQQLLPRLPRQARLADPAPGPARLPALPDEAPTRTRRRPVHSTQEPSHRWTRSLRDSDHLPTPTSLLAATQHGGLITINGTRHWAQAWAFALGGSPTTAPAEAGPTAHWARAILLDTLADHLLAHRQLPDGNQISGILRNALVEAFDQPDSVPDCTHGRLHRSVGIPLTTRTGHGHRKLSLLFRREHAADIAINFFGSHDSGAEEALSLAAAAGAIALAVRRHPSTTPPPPGVTVIDLAPAWHQAPSEHPRASHQRNRRSLTAAT